MRREWVLILALLMLSACSSGPSLYQLLEDNPDAEVNVQKVEGEEAMLFAKSAREFCPELPTEYYKAIISRENSTATEIYDSEGKLLCDVDTSDPEYAEKAIAVLVNDQPIHLAEIQRVVENSPEELSAQEVNGIINNMINRELLLQEAEEREITVSDEEADVWIEENSEVLNQTNTSLLLNAVKERLKIEKLVEQITQEQEEPTEQEMRAYYENNKDNLAAPAAYTVRHIQINYGSRGENVTKRKAETVYRLLNTTDFCELVEQFSQDDSSIDNCGRYTFQQGEMLPAIEEEVGNMETGETRIIKSEQGYHILQLLSKQEGSLATYEQAKEVIRAVLENQAAQNKVTDFVNNLRQEAEIISYLN